MSETILIVEDEEPIREMLAFTLSKAGYSILEAGSVNEAKRIIENRLPGLIILDWMLPGISGVDYARSLRSELLTKHVPIIMLTAKSEEADKVKALDTGADDHITKPFSTKELLARIRALIRRTAEDNAQQTIEIPGLLVNPATCKVIAGEQSVDLSPTEFKLLYFFISHPEKVFSRSQILDKVWGDVVFVGERTVDVHIRRLRKNLESFGIDKNIQTVRSFGYKFSMK